MQLKVNSKHGAYRVQIERNTFIKSLESLSHKHPQSLILLITDDHIHKIYRNQISPFLKDNPHIHLITIKAGEQQKNIHSKILLEKKMFQLGCNRNSIIVAWGGGVIGDLVGFLASTYMRGIPYYALPTSLIAMVDSSIGGKTGIDTPFGKNLIGSIYPPQEVFIDIGFLHSLPEKEFINGCAEVAKYYFIQNKSLGKMIRSAGKDFHADNHKLMTEIVAESLKVKIKVVNRDENEGGLRRILNFGHTFGHALEHLSQYRLGHGYAIAIGMGVEAFWALRKKEITDRDFEEVVNLLHTLKLPTQLPSSYDNHNSFKKLYSVCLQDKKSQDRKVYFVCLSGIARIKSNRGEYREAISEDDFFESLEAYNRFLSRFLSR